MSETESVPDEALVVVILHDISRIGELITRYEAALDRYIMRLGVRTKEDREDVLQEVFIKMYRHLHSYDRSYAFSSWLYRIAHNEAISWYRKHSVRPEGHLVDDEDEFLLLHIMTEEKSADTLFAESANAVVVREALDQLPEKYRFPLILRYFEHKEYDEISDILKIPIGTVGTLIFRGKTQLKKLITSNKVIV